MKERVLYPTFYVYPTRVMKVASIIQHCAEHGFGYTEIAIQVLAALDRKPGEYPPGRFPFRQIKKPGAPFGAPGRRLRS